MKNILTILIALMTKSAFASIYLPDSILTLNDKYSHHVLIIEKQSHALYIYKNNFGIPTLIKKYQIATGKMAGNKLFQGDFRTPEGTYIFNNFIPHSTLLKTYGKKGEIYGVGAFVTNYPNSIDLQLKKSGSGIWLHSTNDETRIEKGLDSRGCVVSANKDLIEISKYIELQNTPIVIVHELKFLEKSVWKNKRKSIKKAVKRWADSWRSKNFKKYISSYHPKFKDRIKGNFKNFARYKRRIFKNKGNLTINLSNLTIVGTNDYLTVTFEQEYLSDTIGDTGIKTLYFKRDQYYNYKIIAENWTKKGLKQNNTNKSIAFEPRLRFFKTTQPSEIMNTTDENKEL